MKNRLALSFFKIAFLLFLLFGLVTERGSILWASQATDILLAKARSLEGRGRLDLAAQALEQVLMAEPNNAEALAGLARYAKQNGKARDAEQYLERLRKVDSKNPAIAQVGEMSSIAPQRGKLEEAQRLAANHDAEGAMRIYRDVFGTNPPAGPWTTAYYETLAATPGGWDDAVAGLEAIVKKYPKTPEYQFSLGRLLTYRPKTRSQGMELLESIKGDSDLVAKARMAWRQALIWENGSPASRTSLEAYLSRYPDAELQSLLTSKAKASVSAPVAEPVHIPAGSIEEGAGYKALNAGRFDEAERRFTEALKVAPKSASALAGRGFVRMKQEDFAGAVPFFEQALAITPKNKTVADALVAARFWQWMKAGTTDLAGNRLEQALQDFRQAHSLRPSNKEAIQGIAGTYMRLRQPAAAIPFYTQLVQIDRDNPDAWSGLVTAQNQAGKPADGLNALKQAPQPVIDKLMRNPEFLLGISFAYADAGNDAESRRMFQKAQEAAGGKNEMAVSLRLEFAGLLLRRHAALQAADAFEEIADSHPTNLDAWLGLFNSLLQVPDTMRAFAALRRMPKETYNAGLLNVDFLRSVANLHLAMRRYDLAEAFLQKAVVLDKSSGKNPDISLQLQLVDVWVHASKTADAERLLREILNDYPDDANAWRALVSLLQTGKRDGAALAEIQRMPLSVRQALEDDPGFTSQEASVYNSVGRYDEALRLIQSTILRLETERRPIPPDLNLQLAWVLMSLEGKQRELYSLLVRISADRNLTQQQRTSLDQIWSTWCLRRAQASWDEGDLTKAISILRAGLQLLPNDPQIQSALAGRLAQSGEHAQAFAIYRRWNLRGGTADDYNAAIGAAMSLNQTEVAETWIKRGLQLYPQNAALLSLAGKQAASVGDYKRAQAYFRRALALAPAQTNPGIAANWGNGITGLTTAERERTLGALLMDSSSGSAEALSTDSLATPAHPISFRQADSPGSNNGVLSAPLRMLDPGPLPEPDPSSALSPDTSSAASKRQKNILGRLFANDENAQSSATPLPRAVPQDPGQPAYDPISPSQISPDPVPQALSPPVRTTDPTSPDMSRSDNNSWSSPGSNILPPLPEPIDPTQKATGGAEKAPISLHDEIQQNLDAIESRNTPYTQIGGSLQGRTGQEGFDKLLIQQADLQASTTIGDQVRLSLIVRPTFLDAGSADGSSSLVSGMQTVAGSTSGVLTASGLSAEGQVSTSMFGLHGGVSGEGFLVRNWVGGIRLNPGHGPITLIFNRDNIRDTMLSFAGQRDPISNQIWGGVVSNTASILGNWGNAVSGFYVNGGYQFIRGKNVAQNSRVDATMGAYFRVVNRKEGSLTVGMNLSAMHYDKNLRYFTFGQGGYFSPQRYFLFNVPMRWTGAWRQVLQYSVSGSLGAQYFSEDASPYFPTLSRAQLLSLLNGQPQPYYSAFGNTGSNFSLSARATYQLAPHWQAGAFFDANNARDYTAAAAGLYLRYLLIPRPIGADLGVQSIPDWRGIQPFALPLN